MGIGDNTMKSVIVVAIRHFTNTSTLLTCRKRIMKHNTRRLMLGSEATILLDIVSSSQLVTHLSVKLVKKTKQNKQSKINKAKYTKKTRVSIDID